MNTTHRRRRIVAGAQVSSGLAAAAIGLAAHANATGPVGPLNWCPGQHLPQPDVHWNMNSCHSYYYVYARQGNVGDGSLGGNNSVWEGPNPPVGPAAGPISHKRSPGQPLPNDGTSADGVAHQVDWDMSVCHTYVGVAYQQGNVGDYIWDLAGGPPPPPPQCPPIAFMCP
jgi:hypothetical protein